MNKLATLERNLSAKKDVTVVENEVDSKEVVAVDNTSKGTVKYWAGLLGFILVSWPPFFGYMFHQAYLSDLGFEAVHVSLSVQESLWFFYAGMSWFIGKINDFEFRWLEFSILIGGVAFVFILVDLMVSDNFREKFNTKTLLLLQGLDYGNSKGSLPKSFLLSMVTWVFVSTLTYILPILLFLVFSIIFVFSVIGYFFGNEAAKDKLVDEKCIYAKSSSDCSVVKIDNFKKKGYVVYSNDKSIFFIDFSGRYLVNDKGLSLQFKPFVIEEIAGLGSESFSPKEWEIKISKRSSMLNDFLTKNKKDLTSDKVFSLLGNSDSKFHYEEFPAYKLSESSTCSVGFPYDWETKKVVNVVLFGKCR